MKNDSKGFLKIDEDIAIKDSECVITLTSQGLQDWCIEISKLYLNIISKLTVLDTKSQKAVLRVVEKKTKYPRCAISSIENGLEFILTKNQIEYFLHTILHTQHNGGIAINHIHIDGTYEDNSYDLTMFFGDGLYTRNLQRP